MSSRRLVLASASPARARMLRNAGFAPTVVVSGVDESGVTGRPAEIAAELAGRKAAAVGGMLRAGNVPVLLGDVDSCLVVGCDSVLEIDGVAYGKPADIDSARRQWQQMAGREGTLHTGHAVLDLQSAKQVSGVASTVVRFGTPDRHELEAYLSSGEPLAVAGSFTLDGLGGVFVEGIIGDPGTVIGISLPLFRNLLADLGVQVTDLWTMPRADLNNSATRGR